MPTPRKFTWAALADAINALDDDAKQGQVVITIQGEVDLEPGGDGDQFEVSGANTDADGNFQLDLHKNT